MTVSQLTSFLGEVRVTRPEDPPPPARPEEPATRSTLSLVRSAQAGDQAALERLYERYLPRLRRWAHGRLPSRARGPLDTEDVVQDALVRTLHRLDHLDPQGGGFFQAYTRQAVLNAIRDRLRRTRDRVPPTAAFEKEADARPSPLEDAIGREALERYERALAQLTVEERELVTARLELHLGWEELARELEKSSADAARMAFKRALAKLAKEMGHARS